MTFPLPLPKTQKKSFLACHNNMVGFLEVKLMSMGSLKTIAPRSLSLSYLSMLNLKQFIRVSTEAPTSLGLLGILLILTVTL